LGGRPEEEKLFLENGHLGMQLGGPLPRLGEGTVLDAVRGRVAFVAGTGSLEGGLGGGGDGPMREMAFVAELAPAVVTEVKANSGLGRGGSSRGPGEECSYGRAGRRRRHVLDGRVDVGDDALDGDPAPTNLVKEGELHLQLRIVGQRPKCMGGEDARTDVHRMVQGEIQVDAELVEKNGELRPGLWGGLGHFDHLTQVVHQGDSGVTQAQGLRTSEEIRDITYTASTDDVKMIDQYGFKQALDSDAQPGFGNIFGRLGDGIGVVVPPGGAQRKDRRLVKKLQHDEALGKKKLIRKLIECVRNNAFRYSLSES
jgi:hypothetical protein